MSISYPPPQPFPPPSAPLPAPPQPAPGKRTKRSRRSGCLWALLGGVLVLVLPIFLAGLWLSGYLLFPPGPLDVLVLGVDARPGEGYLTRTDSVMLLGINPRGLNVSMLSIPRDLFIDTPGYGLQRINAVNVLGEQDADGGGPSLVQAAIAQNFAIEPDRYVRINFDGFIRLVDALGGIDIDVPRRLVDYQYPTADYGTTTVIFEPGWQHMDGETALAYARTRHADDDYRRAERQQQVVAALFSALIKPANWPRIPAALQVLFEAVDTDMTLFDMLNSAPPILLDGASGNIDRLVIDRDLIQWTAGGQPIPNYGVINLWLEERFD